MSSTIAQRQPLAAMGTFARFTLRYNRLRIILWIVIAIFLVDFVAVYYAGLAQSALDDIATAAHTPSMEALVGTITNVDPLGAKVWIKIWMCTAVMLCIGMVFLVTHNLRADEDTGRTELFRSRPLGLHTSFVTTLIMSVCLCVVCGVGISVTLVGLNMNGSSALGCWVFGLSVMAAGLLGVGIAMLTNELAPSSASANGLGMGILGLFYIIRMIGDLKNPSVTWVSPLGWAEKMDPWGNNLLWPILPVVALAAVFTGLGWIIEAKRDYGGSLFAVRAGHADASKSMLTVWGLGLRLQRVSIVVWIITIAIFAALFGTVTQLMGDVLTSSGLGLTGDTGLGAIIALLVCFLSLAIGAFVIQSSCMMVLEDTHGLLESQLAGSVSRTSWALQRMTVTIVTTVVLLLVGGLCFGASYSATSGDSSQMWPIIGTSLAYMPSLLIFLGLVVLGFGWWPRVAVGVSWGVFGLFWVLMVVGETLRLPDWVIGNLPFLSMAAVPAEPISWAKFFVTLLVAVAMIVVGLIGLRRRNVPA